MATPAQSTPLRLAAASGAAEPVPVAFLGRTSTLEMQDPRASLSRQIRAARAWLPPGWFITAWYWDIESGGLDLDQRGRGTAWQAVTGVGIPRDGGLADLLAEAGSGAPAFAAVVCEDIERSGRDTFNALRLEKKLSAAGIPLFATDEPAVIEGLNATTVLVRRVKQGVAEWLRLQIKEKTWKGLVEHSLDGWNIGAPPYGYLADRVPHPVPVKASQGRSKTRLAPDPDRAPVVARIFTWRVIGKLGMPAIAARLNNNPARYPPPAGGRWSAQAVAKILANPKYTGHMVYGRRRRGPAGQRLRVPVTEWLWTPEPVHPALIDTDTWAAAQDIAAAHGTSRDGHAKSAHPAARSTYPYRGRVRCRDCRRRMCGTTSSNSYGTRTYYRDPYDPANPHHAAACPDHPRTVRAPETTLDAITGLFFRDHIFGPGRSGLLAAQLPATDAAAAAARDAAAAALTARIRQNEAAQKAQILAQEELPADPADAAAAAMRARIRDRFTELHHERQQLQAQLDALAAVTPKAADTTLLDELPLAGDILPSLPPDLKTRLLEAFDIQILWNKTAGQATVHAEITDATLRTVLAILNPSQDGYDDTSEHNPAGAAGRDYLFDPPMTGVLTRDPRTVPPRAWPAAARSPAGVSPSPAAGAARATAGRVARSVNGSGSGTVRPGSASPRPAP